MWQMNWKNSTAVFAPEGVVGSSSGSGVPGGAASATSSAPADSGAPSGASSQTPVDTSQSGTQDTTDKKDDPPGFGEDFFGSMSEVEVEAAPPGTPDIKPPDSVPAKEAPKPKEPSPKEPETPSPSEPEVKEPEAAKSDDAATASLPLHSPGQLAQAMRANEPQLLSALEKQYVLSPEDVEALEGDATATVPKLLARVHMNVVTSVLGNLQDIVPAMLAERMSTYQSAQESLDKFFGMWPQLDKVKHRDLVLDIGRKYRAMYPKAKPEEMMMDVGQMVALRAKVPLTGSTQPSAAGANGVRPPPASPFIPARGGGAAPPNNAPDNEWEGAYSNE
jgi:hypothetical protein